jgi:hypothetical protein
MIAVRRVEWFWAVIWYYDFRFLEFHLQFFFLISLNEDTNSYFNVPFFVLLLCSPLLYFSNKSTFQIYFSNIQWSSTSVFNVAATIINGSMCFHQELTT